MNERTIEKIQDSIAALQAEQTKQGFQIENVKETLVRHDKQFEKITLSILDLSSTMTNIQTTMAKMSFTLEANTESLKEHMRRTENLEKRVLPLEKAYWKLIGGSFVVSAIAAILTAAITKLIP